MEHKFHHYLQSVTFDPVHIKTSQHVYLRSSFHVFLPHACVSQLIYFLEIFHQKFDIQIFVMHSVPLFNSPNTVFTVVRQK